jgi:hypothetical protein
VLAGWQFANGLAALQAVKDSRENAPTSSSGMTVGHARAAGDMLEALAELRP